MPIQLTPLENEIDRFRCTFVLLDRVHGRVGRGRVLQKYCWHTTIDSQIHVYTRFGIKTTRRNVVDRKTSCAQHNITSQTMNTTRKLDNLYKNPLLLFPLEASHNGYRFPLVFWPMTRQGLRTRDNIRCVPVRSFFP